MLLPQCTTLSCGSILWPKTSCCAAATSALSTFLHCMAAVAPPRASAFFIFHFNDLLLLFVFVQHNNLLRKKWDFALRAHQIEAEKHRIQCCKWFWCVFCYVAAAACDKRQRAPTKRPTAHRRKKSARQISQANARAKCKTALACLPQDAVLCCWFLFFFFNVQRRIITCENVKIDELAVQWMWQTFPRYALTDQRTCSRWLPAAFLHLNRALLLLLLRTCYRFSLSLQYTFIKSRCHTLKCVCVS